MNSRHFKHEGWLVGLAFLLALGLRFAQLGALPLTDAEAGPALQALHIAQGLKPALSPHPLYILLTSALFFLYGGATNFLARCLPALVGSALVFVPFLFQERLKPRASLFLAFFLAIEPGVVSLSREAASSIFAITFLLFAWGFWINNRTRLAGTFAALALLGGPSIWAGLLGLGITWAIRQGLEYRKADSESSTLNLKPSTFNLQHPALLSFIATFIIAGALFFLAPNGLSAALGSLPAYLRGWVEPSGIASGRLLFSLIVYQPIAVILALIAILRGWRHGSRRIIRLTLWLSVTLLLAVFPPARQTSDLAWCLIPLWALAALELTRHLNALPAERREVISVVLLTTLILVFSWLNLAGTIWISAPSSEFSIRVWLLLGSVLLLVVSLTLVAYGWSVRSARLGGIWGLTLTLGALTLGGALGSAGLRGAAYPELWPQQARPAQADLLLATVNDVSNWGSGDNNALPVTIAGINSPALEWVLRDRQVNQVETLDPTASPPFVITPPQADPNLAAAYRGQDFTWRQNPAWDTAQWNTWLRWIVLRDMPQDGETLILWARSDLFLDSAHQTTP